jgi:hypothetical protein
VIRYQVHPAFGIRHSAFGIPWPLTRGIAAKPGARSCW